MLEIDRTYHPLDRELLARHYLPGLTAPMSVEALVARRAARARVYGYASLFKLRAADTFDPKPTPPRLMDKLGAMFGGARAKDVAAKGRPGFDVNVYLYGRPFFITESDPARVAEILEGLLNEEREDELIRTFQAQAAYFDEGKAEEIAAFVKRKPPLPKPADKVKKSFEKILDDRQVALRDALLSLGRADRVPEGIAEGALEEDPELDQKSRLDPVARFAHLAAYGMGLVLAEVHPFWTHRTGWDLAEIVRLVAPESPASSHGMLLEPLYELVPEAREHATAEIRHHYTAGAVVPAEQIDAVLGKLVQGRGRFLEAAQSGSLDRKPENFHAKLVEALTYAKRKGWGLLEVGEVIVAAEGGMP